jgi:hypothetical protein
VAPYLELAIDCKQFVQSIAFASGMRQDACGSPRTVTMAPSLTGESNDQGAFVAAAHR